MTVPLTAICQKSLEDSSLPEDWITANVIPLFKNGSRLDAPNYRPVSLTCVCCEVMESVIRDYLVESVATSGILTSFPHGFAKGRSYATDLGLLVNLNGYMRVRDIIYLDNRKALDSVSHIKLIEKLLLLLYVDASLTLITWIAAFFTG